MCSFLPRSATPNEGGRNAAMNYYFKSTRKYFNLSCEIDFVIFRCSRYGRDVGSDDDARPRGKMHVMIQMSAASSAPRFAR